jgi:hypothetical protein
VNGDLARSECRRATPAAGASREKTNRESASPPMTGEDRRRLRVARDRHPAVAASPKAVWRSWGRGCNDHRILRRVPADGRHPGSSRSVGRHGSATTVVLAVSPLSDPYQAFSKKDVRPACSSHEGGRGARVNGAVATGVSEARSHQRRGKKMPTPSLQAVRQ